MTHAIRFHKTGGPEVLVWEEVALGKPGPGEARIRHTAVGLNFVDIYNRSGLYPAQLPSGLGGEAAGVVEEVGSGVTDLKPGDRVAYGSAPIGAYAEARLTSKEPGVYERSRVGELLRCAWHGWEFDMRNGQSWFDPKRVKIRSYPVAIESGEEIAKELEDGLEKGPYVAETFAVHVEDSYVIIEI